MGVLQAVTRNSLQEQVLRPVMGIYNVNSLADSDFNDDFNNDYGNYDYYRSFLVPAAAFSNAFSAAFDNMGPKRREFSSAFSVAFGIYDRLRSFEEFAFSDAFSKENR